MAELKPKAKAQQPKPEQPKAESNLQVKTAANVTLMIHPFTQVRFTGTPVEVESIDSWLQAQIDAKKLEVI